MRRILRWGLITIASIGINGCATVLQPGPEWVPVSSNPQGAHVFLDGTLVGTTPTVVRVPHESQGRLSFISQRDDNVTHVFEERQIPRVVNEWFFGNILLGIPFIVPLAVGVGVDLLKKNHVKFSEETISVDFGGAR